MTKALYHTDSYLKEFESRIEGVDPEARAVLLHETAFYPGGGGQPCDYGRLTTSAESFPVVSVKKQGDTVWHYMGGTDLVPAAGEVARGELDWPRRYSLMRTHTAMHILCGVVFRDYGALVTGGNMDPLEGRMDFEFETMHAELVSAIEKAINREVAADREVRVANLPREEAFQIPDLIRTKISLLPPDIAQVRTVEIVGLDLQADGGTHVHSTSEVGHIHVTDYKSKGAINKRIYISLEQSA